MSATAAFLPPIVMLLAASVIVVAVFRRLHVSPVLGYFAAGAMIGTHGLGIVSAEDTRSFAEFGVVFLLFMIGLELTFERLLAMRRYIFGFGTAQVLLSALFIGGVVYVLSYNVTPALIIGGGLALSSTAIVLQVLAEGRREATQTGRLALAILLLQDFAVVPLLVLMPLLAKKTDGLMSVLGIAFVKAVGVLFAIFILGRLFLRPFFSMIASANPARSNELFVATTLLIALGAAWATEAWGLSLALGAFMAGLLVAETEFKHHVEESISPFKALLLGLFFMTVGMSINMEFMLEKLPLIITLSFCLILLKALVIFGLCLLFKFPLSTAIQTGLLLAQGGEFAFVLFRLAGENQLIDIILEQILLMVVVTTMALTPLLALLGQWCAERLERARTQVQHVDDAQTEKESEDLDQHVIIAGFGRVGKMVGRLLSEEDVHYVALEQDIKHARESHEEGFPVFAGDASDINKLEAVGIARARAVIVSIENEVLVTKVLKTVHKHYPYMPVVVRAKDMSDAERLRGDGAATIVPETYETGLQLAGAILKEAGFSGEEISRLKNRFRAGDYVRAKELE